MALFGSDSALKIVVSLQDDASKAMKKLEGNLDSLSDKLKRPADASGKFALALGGAGVALGAFGLSAIKSAANMEQSQIAFETMLGSAEVAKKFYGDLVSFAAKTPFTLTGLEDASKSLLAYGITQEKILPDLKALGDIAAGVGMEKLPNLILAFGQVSAKGRLMGDDLKQFTSAGIPLLDMLSQQFKKPVSAIQEMVSAGEIGFPAVEQALKSLSGEGGRFDNLMEKQAKTLGGMWSNLQDAWEQFLRAEGAQLIDWAKQFTSALIYLVQNVLPEVVKKIQETTEWFGQHSTAIYIIAGAIIGALVPAIFSAVVAFASLALALAPFIIGGAIIGALVAGIVWIVQNWDLIRNKTMEIWNSIMGFLSGVWQTITSTISGVWNGIVAVFNTVWGAITTVFQFALALIVGLVITMFAAMGIDIVAVFENIKNFLVATWDFITTTVSGAMEVVSAIWQEAWGGISSYFVGIWNDIKSIAQAGWSWLSEKFKVFSEPVSKAWSTLWSGLTSTVTMAWEGVKNVIKDSINWIIDKINTLIKAINDVAKKGAGTIGFTAPQIPEVPKLASGGIVTKPTLAMIGEAGPEAVVPLKRGGAGAGLGNINIVINNPVVRSDSDLREIERQLDQVMRSLLINHKISTA